MAFTSSGRRSGRNAPRRYPGRPAPGPSLTDLLPYIGIAALAIGALTVYLLIPETVERDRETLCPVDGPVALTAVLIDTTGNLDGVTATDALTRLSRILDNSRPDEMFTVWNMRGDNPEAPDDDGVFRWDPPSSTSPVCRPADLDDVSEFFENRRMLERALNEKFLQPIDAAFNQLVRVDSTADFSPLIETMQFVRSGFFGLPELEGRPGRIVLVTDLLQNSRLLSFNRTGRAAGAAPFRGRLPDYDEFSKTQEGRGLQVDLEGFDVEVLFVERTVHASLGDDGTRKLVDWWDRWFTDQGATLQRVVRLDGLSP